MKKFFFFAAAVVSMAACQKEAQLSSNDFTAPVEEGAAVAVEFCSNVKASVATKAQGGVDAWNAAQNLHIYGYQRVADGVDYTTAVPFINNVVAASPAADVHAPSAHSHPCSCAEYPAHPSAHIGRSRRCTG